MAEIPFLRTFLVSLGIPVAMTGRALAQVPSTTLPDLEEAARRLIQDGSTPGRFHAVFDPRYDRLVEEAQRHLEQFGVDQAAFTQAVNEPHTGAIVILSLAAAALAAVGVSLYTRAGGSRDARHFARDTNATDVVRLSEKPKSTPRANVLLHAGANSNETSWGETPELLAGQGAEVAVAVFPGYEDPNDPSFLEGGLRRGRALEKIWKGQLPRAARLILETAQENCPLFIGGFSLGGCAALRSYASLPPALQARVKGLILVAPSLRFRGLTKISWGLRGLVRHALMPLLTLLRRHRDREVPVVAEQFAGSLQSLTHRPWSSELAATRYAEGTEEVLKRLAKRQRRWEGEPLPPVLVISGEEDRTVDSKASLRLIENTFTDVTTHQVPGEHWVLVGKGASEATALIQGFIDSHHG